jgi:hypothetical protein
VDRMSLPKTIKKLLPDEVTLGVDSSGPHAEVTWKTKKTGPVRFRTTAQSRLTRSLHENKAKRYEKMLRRRNPLDLVEEDPLKRMYRQTRDPEVKRELRRLMA